MIFNTEATKKGAHTYEFQKNTHKMLIFKKAL